MFAPPLLSVVIPTHKRPHYVARAIESALTAAPDGDVEVIVVPNGTDTSWKTVAEHFSKQTEVIWIPIARAHANSARNHGLQHARGKYIRFLDDDDSLLAEGAQAQCILLEKTGADVCSSPIYLTDDRSNRLSVAYQPDTPDFISAMLSHKRMHQLTAHLLRRSSVKHLLWNEKLDFSQDNDWILRLCHDMDLVWVKANQPCGHWRLHTQKRISTWAPLHARKVIIADGILKAIEALKRRNALSCGRREAAASGLWDLVHQSLFASPRYWTRIAESALALDPNSRPDLRMHNCGLSLIGVGPLAIEYAAAPKRLVHYVGRRLLLAAGLLKNW